MAEKRTATGSTRLVARQRRRTEHERRDRLVHLIPFGVLGLAAVFLVGLGVFGLLRSNGAFEDPNGKAQFTVDSDRLELGDQKLGATVRARFNIRNTGNGTLRMQVPAMPTTLEGC